MDHADAPATVPLTEVVEALNDLLQLDHDAIGAYQIAIERLEDAGLRTRVSSFRADHERHVRELNDAILALGGTPVNEPHLTGPFGEALQSLGALGGDRGVLVAWRTNELRVRTRYAGCASRAAAWPEPARAVVQRNALDEERHYRWVSGALEGLGVGRGDAPEARPVERLRGRVEAHAQASPLRAVLATFATGFIIGRILR